MQISDDARKIQIKIYKILAASYILQGKQDVAQCCARAADEATRAAVFFDRRFPANPTVDVTPAAPAAETEEPEEILTGWAPGVTPPNGGSTNGAAKQG